MLAASCFQGWDGTRSLMHAKHTPPLSWYLALSSYPTLLPLLAMISLGRVMGARPKGMD